MIQVFQQPRGQATLLSVIAMGSFLAVVLAFIAQYSKDLARLSDRSKENLLIQAVIEDIGVELRRAYDIAGVSGNTCLFSGATAYGTVDTVGLPPNPLRLCLKSVNQICVSRAGSFRSYCASYNMMTTARNHFPDSKLDHHLIAIIERDTKWQDWKEIFLETFSALPRFDFISEAQAQKSDFSRPPLPNPASTTNALNPIGPGIAIRCRSDAAAPPSMIQADCITVSICDSGLDCTQAKNIITQRYAFIRN